MKPDFKINCQIEEVYIKKNADGVAKPYLKGLASGTSLDGEEEKMAASAIFAFREAVHRGIYLDTGEWSQIPLRKGHDDEWYSIVGWLTDAYIDDQFNFYVEAELDTINADAALLYRNLTEPVKHGRPIKMGLSIGGIVVSAGTEWDETIQRYVRVYYDVALKEVSVVTRPAYTQSFVQAMTKSMDWSKVGGRTNFGDADEEIFMKTPKWTSPTDSTLPIIESENLDVSVSRERIFSWAGWPNEFSPEKAQKAFLLYDSNAPTLKGSYKLPFADVVDGNLAVNSSSLDALELQLDKMNAPSDVLNDAREVLRKYKQRGDEPVEIEKGTLTSMNTNEDQNLTDSGMSFAGLVAPVGTVEVDKTAPTATDAEDLTKNDAGVNSEEEVTKDVTDPIAELTEKLNALTESFDTIVKSFTALTEKLETATAPVEEVITEKNVVEATEEEEVTKSTAPSFSVEDIANAVSEAIAKAIQPLTKRVTELEEEPIDKSISVSTADDVTPLQKFVSESEGLTGKAALAKAFELATASK